MNRSWPTFAAAVLTVGGLSACSSPASDDQPIKLGAVSSLTGPGTFSGASEAAQAVFDAVNADGGIDGRQIDYLVEDDQNNPSTAAQAARRLISSDQVVAMVGSASVLECQVNAALYDQQGLVSIPAVGADNGCFTSEAISPVNTGPFVATTAALTYASTTLEAERLCYLQNDIPGTQEAYTAAVDAWSESTGAAPLTYDYRDMQLDGDPTAQVLAVGQNRCDTVVLQTLEPQAIAMITAADRQGIEDVTWVLSSSNYTAGTAQALASTGQRILAAAEFAPFTDEAAMPEDFTSTLTEADAPINSFAEGGYVAAQAMVEALRSIDGEITKESVAEAVAAVDYETPILASPYTFGAEGGANRSIRIVELADGQWSPVDDEWITVE